MDDFFVAEGGGFGRRFDLDADGHTKYRRASDVTMMPRGGGGGGVVVVVVVWWWW
jgi:hypothetical protein